MLPPSMLPELINDSTLDRYGRSALPGAPVRRSNGRRRWTRIRRPTER